MEPTTLAQATFQQRDGVVFNFENPPQINLWSLMVVANELLKSDTDLPILDISGTDLTDDLPPQIVVSAPKPESADVQITIRHMNRFQILSFAVYLEKWTHEQYMNQRMMAQLEQQRAAQVRSQLRLQQ